MGDVERLAERIVARVLREQGVTKSAGAVNRAQLLPMALAVAGGLAEVEELMAERNKLLKRNMKVLKRNGRRVRELAAAHGVPGAAEVERRMVDLDLRRFGVGLVDRGQVPKAANGHHGAVDEGDL